MALGQGYPGASGSWGQMRAADADRERAVDLLKAAYSEGRLSKDEYDARVETALSARTYGDLTQLTVDLPGAGATMLRPMPRAPMVPPVVKTNSLAIASLVCGLGQFVFFPVVTIPAIVLGHMARHQIRRSGERGSGMALAGLILGWGGLIFGIIALGIVMATFTSRGGSFQVGPIPTPPMP